MALCSFSVVGFGMDPDLQLDIITELDLVNTTLGVTQVSGLHNTSKAFLFQGKGISLLCMGSGLGEEFGVCLGRVPLECICWVIISVTSPMLSPWGMFRDAEGA